MGMLFNDTIDLGPTVEGFRAFKRFGQLSPNSRYGILHGVLHAILDESKNVPKEDLDAVSYQSGQFLKEFGSKLSDHEKWILTQLRGCNS